MRNSFKNGIWILVLALAIVGGWAVTRTVQERTASLPGIQACWRLDGSGDQTECLSTVIQRAAAVETKSETGPGLDRATAGFVRSVEVLAQDDARLAGSCHPAMHELGRSRGRAVAAAQRDPVFPKGSSQLCTAGYVHGLAEGYLTGATDAKVLAVFPRLCHETAAREGCAHGVGHALVRARVDQPAHEAALGATNECRELPGDFGTNCMNGVFMELAMRRQPDPLAPQEFVDACAAMEIAESLACWGYLSTNLRTNDRPLAQTPTWCSKASLPGQFSCIDQYGRDLGVERVAACQSVSDPVELRQRCVDGAIGLQIGSGHVSRADAVDRCEELGPEDLVAYCTRAVTRYSKGREKVERS